jgi:hypothetical protein
MKSTLKTSCSRTVCGLVSALVFLLFLSSQPRVSLASETDPVSTSWYERFQVEFYGGFTTLNPSDLNLFVDYDNRIQEFTYDSMLNYLESISQILSWNKVREEDRRKIKKAFPLGGRLKYQIKDTLAVSIGFRYFSRTRESEFDFEYIRNEIEGDRYTEILSYFPYSLSVNAYVPQIGIHMMKRIKGALVLEGYLAGGPLFVECRYFSNWSYELHRREVSNFEYLVFQSAGALDEEGTGTGIAIDLGGRMNYPLLKNMGIFLEAGYAYQVVRNVSGPGSELNGPFSESWAGRWAIKQEQINAPWGELEAELPTGYWPSGSSGRIRNFKLDLSGFQLRLGLSFQF